MIKITKSLFQKALIAGFFYFYYWCSCFTYLQKYLGIFYCCIFWFVYGIIVWISRKSFCTTKKCFFGHLLTAVVGVIFVHLIPLPIYMNIALGVGVGVCLMILFNVVHPPAGGNPIIVIIGSASYDYLINPIIFGSIIILLLAILINKYILKKNYPLN